MAERQAMIGPEEGLHARPAAQFVKTLSDFWEMTCWSMDSDSIENRYPGKKTSS